MIEKLSYFYIEMVSFSVQFYDRDSGIVRDKMSFSITGDDHLVVYETS